MEKTQKLTVGLCGIALIFLLALSACKHDSGGEEPNVNELKGKTFYVADTYKTEFYADLTFEKLTWVKDYEEEEEDIWYWGSHAKGTYTYNSKEKKFTVTVTQHWEEDDEGILRWATESEAENKAWFVPKVYTYAITTDGSLLAQRISTDKGVDELKGKTFTYFNLADRPREHTFSASGKTFSYDDRDRGKITGTYYFDSTTTPKTVRLRPTSVDGKTMAQYYAAYDVTDNWTPHAKPADIKAAVTNDAFAGVEFEYNTDTETFLLVFNF
jgi:hypothetical protein